MAKKKTKTKTKKSKIKRTPRILKDKKGRRYVMVDKKKYYINSKLKDQDLLKYIVKNLFKVIKMDRNKKKRSYKKSIKDLKKPLQSELKSDLNKALSKDEPKESQVKEISNSLKTLSKLNNLQSGVPSFYLNDRQKLQSQLSVLSGIENQHDQRLNNLTAQIIQMQSQNQQQAQRQNQQQNQ